MRLEAALLALLDFSDFSLIDQECQNCLQIILSRLFAVVFGKIILIRFNTDVTKTRNRDEQRARGTGKWIMETKQRIGNEATDRAGFQVMFCSYFSSSLSVPRFSNIRFNALSTVFLFVFKLH